MELQTSVQFDCRNQKAIQEMQLKVLQIERKRENWRKIPPQTKNLSPFSPAFIFSNKIYKTSLLKLACSQTLYFLFKVRRARVIKNKPRGIYWPPAQRDARLALQTGTTHCFVTVDLLIFYTLSFHLQYKHSGTSANRKYLQTYRHKWLKMKALTTFFFKRERYNRTWWTLFWTHGFVLLSNWLKLWFQEQKVMRSMRTDYYIFK